MHYLMKALFLVPQIGFNDTELFTIKHYLEKNKIQCCLASFSKGKVISKTGKSTVAREMFSNVNIDNYDCFIIVGGMNISSLVEYDCVVDLIKGANAESKLIVLLCMSAALFSSVTDILKGKKATVFKNKNAWAVENLLNNGVIHVDEPIVVDKNIITCRDEKDSLELAKTIVDFLK